MPEHREDVNSLRLGDGRIWIQKGGPGPGNPYEYYGCLTLTDPTQSEGDPSPIYCPSPYVRNDFDIVDETPGQRELGSVDFSQLADRGMHDVWWALRRQRGNFNLQAVYGRCQSADDFDDWESKIIYRRARLTDFTGPGANPQSADDNGAGMITGSLSFWMFEPILPLVFQEGADTVVVAPVLDGFYRDTIQNGECGPVSDGCQKSYWLTQNNTGSPGLSSQIVRLVRSNEGTIASYTHDITGLGGASAARILPVGKYLVILRGATTPSHIYASFDVLDDGVPVFTTVTGGYVATKYPNAGYSRSSRQTFIAAEDGYIYLMTDPTRAVQVLTDGTLTVQDMNDIHGSGLEIVAVGDSNAILFSRNGGQSFQLRVGPSVGVNLTAVSVLTKNVWLVGNASGNLYYTNNEGKTWSEIELDGDVTNIRRIRMVDDVVGYLSADVGGNGRVYRSTTGGFSWRYTKPELDGLTDTTQVPALAACGYNELAVGGTVSGGDGIIAIAR